VSNTNGYHKDRAVRDIQRLPRNRNVAVQRDVLYTCILCTDPYITTHLVEAWYHSSNEHGPWPVQATATLAPLHGPGAPLYNHSIFAVKDAPDVRRIGGPK
jgi:hypothetical protein